MKSIHKNPVLASMLLCFFVLSACSSPIAENENQADIFGKVVNENGEAERSSVVEILELQETTTTDELGNYSFASVSAGEYTLLTQAKSLIPSFKSVSKTSGVQVNTDVSLKSRASFSGDGYQFAHGQSHTIGNVTVSFTEVLSDSRCAVDATCVWAGSGRVALNLSSNGQNVSIFVDSNDLNDFTSTVEAFGLVIRLENLDPLPQLGEVINQTDYNVLLEIN